MSTLSSESSPADANLEGATTTRDQSRPSRAWWPLGIVVVGVILRVVYMCGTDVRNVYDDHFPVVRIMLEQQRWPRPDEAWEAYQPPLYYALSALSYAVVAGQTHMPPTPQRTPEQLSSAEGIPCPYAWHVAGRKAIQFLSTLSGVATLVLAWRMLRRLFPGSPEVQSVAVALVAFLPRHIYMSGMATNDAMTYLWATLAVYGLVRALVPDDRSNSGYRWWTLAGVAVALALWTKQYGLGSLGVLFAAGVGAVFFRNGAARWRAVRGAALAVVVAVLLGVWPYFRMWQYTGNPLTSAHTLHPGRIDLQLPGDVSQISFTSLRLPSLLACPWVHLSTVDSYWSAVFAELWFDYGQAATLYQYRPWMRYEFSIWGNKSLNGRERERRGLDWDLTLVPGSMLWSGRVLIALGVIPTALMVVGLFAMWRRVGVTLGLVLAASLAFGLATPLFQTLRQPFRSSMKATFVLCALPALAVLCGIGWQWLTQRRWGRWLAWVAVANLVLLAAVVTCHFLDLAVVFPGTLDYFARRDPL
jgi:4-amino-4-deoxy-L-arabinose transferase-like glycosyltransferase